MGAAEKSLSNLGFVLPVAPAPVGGYRSAHVIDSLVYTSGQLSWKDGTIRYPGRIGGEVTLEEGRAAATLATLNLLAQLKLACEGNLDRIAGCARISCHLACVDRFVDHATVIEPVSDILLAVFGSEIGAHARLAYGSPSLPFNSPIEVEGIFKLAAK
jgi:enamine deaminase RidA (YjgF/YER057c/UK114 family)